MFFCIYLLYLFVSCICNLNHFSCILGYMMGKQDCQSSISIILFRCHYLLILASIHVDVHSLLSRSFVTLISIRSGRGCKAQTLLMLLFCARFVVIFLSLQYVVVKFLKTRQESAERLGILCINLFGYDTDNTHVELQNTIVS